MRFLSQKKRAAVLVPIYKEGLSPSEELSLLNTLYIMSKWDIYIIGPESLFSWIVNYRKNKNLQFRLSLFSNKWFYSISTYNRLLMSRFFYKHFSGYEYILIVQTDALVLSDRLRYWCDQGYSYIGAPWFEGMQEPVPPHKLIGVGNGGFSLRRIDDFLRILRLPRYIPNIKKNEISMVCKIKNFFSFLLVPYSIVHHFPRVNEDILWGLWTPLHFNFFEVPDPEKAAHFSFEVCPEVLFEITGHRLPFGCHAWEKYNPSFWVDVLGARGVGKIEQIGPDKLSGSFPTIDCK